MNEPCLQILDVTTSECLMGQEAGCSQHLNAIQSISGFHVDFAEIKEALDLYEAGLKLLLLNGRKWQLRSISDLESLAWVTIEDSAAEFVQNVKSAWKV